MQHDVRYKRRIERIERPRGQVRPVHHVSTPVNVVSQVPVAHATKLSPPQPVTQKTTQQPQEVRSFLPPVLHRSGLRIKRTVRSVIRKPAVVYSMAFVVFGIGMTASLQSLFVNNVAQDQIKVLSATSANGSTSGDIPSEEEPKGDYVGIYKTAPSLPRRIMIPSIGVKARVLQVGVNADNQMGTPKNIFDTAWYSASSKPGEMGAMVIDGHYSGPNTKGVFSKLDHLKPGDVIRVERGDGTIYSYAVASVETKPANEVDMSRLLVSANTNIPGLSLITCGGDYNIKTNEFANRTIVYATQI